MDPTGLDFVLYICLPITVLFIAAAVVIKSRRNKPVNQYTESPIVVSPPPPPPIYDPNGCPYSVAGHKVLYRINNPSGFGEVFMVESPDKQRRLALKMLFKHFEDNVVVKRRLISEGDVLQALHNTAQNLGVTQCPFPQFDRAGFWDKGGRHYIIMEFLDGIPLNKLLWPDDARAGYPRSIEEIQTVARDMALALHLMRESNYCHMDVKPQNIMVWLHPQTKQILRAVLIDFGAAITLLPRMAVQFATPPYASPSVMQEGLYSPRTDVYALGVVLMEMATGVAVGGSEMLPAIPREIAPVVMNLLQQCGLPTPGTIVQSPVAALTLYQSLTQSTQPRTAEHVKPKPPVVQR